MWGFLILLGICLIVYIICDTLKFNNLDKTDRIMKDSLNKQLNLINYNLSNSFIYVYRHNIGAIAISEAQKKIVFINKSTNLKPVCFDFQSVIGEKVRIDGDTVTSSSVGETIGRSLIGGMIAGGVGAVIGGLSGSKISKKDTKTIELEIIINDLNCSSLIIPFFINDISDRLAQAEKNIMQWDSILKVIIYQNNTSTIGGVNIKGE